MMPIRKVLIANRGEIARRIIDTSRAMGIRSVAVYSDADADAPFVHEADEAVPLGGTASADSYLRQDLLLDAARLTGADAIHPGYGFLAENATFARVCTNAGLVFVGPPAAAIETMGDKLRAKVLMRDAGVPVLPEADVSTVADEDVGAVAADVGYPLLVKAAAGGGGKGMRVVLAPDDLADAVAGARRESSAAFGDDRVFLERYVERSRHIEVQVLGDQHGNVVHLFERECSIQRRYQKIVEEAPSSAVDEATRERLGAAAIRAAQAVDYVGAGTVEFLFDDEEFWFLEMNTRLQVEHPVTECVTGLDLVQLQLLVAEGHPLPPAVHQATIRGHAIEARLYAEDPMAGFMPASGTVRRFELPLRRGIRVDSGVESGVEVTPHYDPMIAKIIAHAETRTEAARSLASVLHDLTCSGVVTNRELLVGVLEHPEFLAGDIDTMFLDRHPPKTLMADRDEVDRIHSVVAALARDHRLHAATLLPSLPSGWRNNPSSPQRMTFTARDAGYDVAYGRGDVTVNAEVVTVVLHRRDGSLVDATIDGVRRRFRVRIVGHDFDVDSSLGASSLREVPALPHANEQAAEGALAAPAPGTVVRVEVQVGDEVASGDVLVVVESMKMEHAVTAAVEGIVSQIHVGPGDQIDPGTTLLVVDEAANKTGGDQT